MLLQSNCLLHLLFPAKLFSETNQVTAWGMNPWETWTMRQEQTSLQSQLLKAMLSNYSASRINRRTTFCIESREGIMKTLNPCFTYPDMNSNSNRSDIRDKERKKTASKLMRGDPTEDAIRLPSCDADTLLTLTLKRQTFVISRIEDTMSVK